mgnify:CR=1 FL=1
MGFVHVIESNGTVSNPNFPYEIGDNVWGSIAANDIDLDGDVEVFGGTTGDLNIYDIKQNSQENNYWRLLSRFL